MSQTLAFILFIYFFFLEMGGRNRTVLFFLDKFILGDLTAFLAMSGKNRTIFVIRRSLLKEEKCFVGSLFYCPACLRLVRHSCYNFCSAYVRAFVRESVRICPGHNFYIYAWISKQFGTVVVLEE